jgi:ABC-type iron transport system FetAB ATPase subunit
MIEDLVIENFRLFKRVQIDSLARVNLIVGSNNAGKSTLLEAVHLLSSEDMGAGLISVLSERGEAVPNIADSRYRRVRPANIFQVAQLFHGRTVDFNTVVDIHAPASTRLRMSVHEVNSVTDSEETYQPRLFNEAVALQEKSVIPFAQVAAFQMTRTAPDLPSQNVRFRMTEEGIHVERYYASDIDKRSRLVTPSYLAYDELALLWDSILLTPREDKVVEALQILEPRVERISFTSNLTSNSGILIRLKGEERPIPLGSMGDGMRRILAIIASLVSVGNGTLLVDEIDTGLYYDVLENMWQLVFQTAIKQNAQVFATTHSWDCVKAFQQALTRSEHPETGKLLRLERQNESIKAITYSASELEIAVQQGIEVR